MADGPAKAMTEAPNVRDHLANERTFLAWIRTSISLLGFGVLIAKLRFLEVGAGLRPGTGVRSTHLGLTFACAGILTLLLSAWQYVRTRHMLEEGDYKAPVALIVAFVAIVFVLGLASVLYLLSIFK